MSKFQNENKEKMYEKFKEQVIYEYEKNTFVVTTKFDEKSNETLGTILVRLMKNDKKI